MVPITLVEAEPENEIWQAALKQGLVQAMLSKAQSLLDLISKLGAGSTYSAHAEGSGVIAQDRSVATGKGGTAVKGDVHGSIIYGNRNIGGDVGGDVDMSDRRVEQKGKYNVSIGSAEGISIGDHAKVLHQHGRKEEPATPDPATEIELLLATYQKQLVLASGSEAAKLEVQIGQLQQDIRSAERRVDELSAGA